MKVAFTPVTIGVVVTFLATAAGAVASSQTILDVQPFALKAWVDDKLGALIAQFTQSTTRQNFDRIDFLEFQITSLKNQRAQLRKSQQEHPSADIQEQLLDTDASIAKRQAELDLLQCIVQLRPGCNR